MSRLFLVRHATSFPPAADGLDDHQRPLTHVGRRQAEALIARLTVDSPSRVLSSPFLRAVQTVAPTAAALGLAVETRDALKEWSSGISATPNWEAHYRRCWEEPDWSVLGGETHRALEERAIRALEQIATEGPPEAVTVVASHGTWITRALHALGRNVDANFWLNMPMPAVFHVVMAGDPATVTGPGLGEP